MFWLGFDLEKHTEACCVHWPGVLTRDPQITPSFPTNYQMIHCNSKRKNNGASCLINRRMPHHNGLLIKTSASTDWLPPKPPRIMAHGSEHFSVMTQTSDQSWCIFWQWRQIACTLCVWFDICVRTTWHDFSLSFTHPVPQVGSIVWKRHNAVRLDDNAGRAITGYKSFCWCCGKTVKLQLKMFSSCLNW